MVKRQSKKGKVENATFSRTNSHRQLQWRSMQGKWFVVLGNFIELLKSHFHPQRSYKSNAYIGLGFNKATSQKEWNASPLHDFRLTLALGGHNHTNWLLINLRLVFDVLIFLIAEGLSTIKRQIAIERGDYHGFYDILHNKIEESYWNDIRHTERSFGNALQQKD
jgi:hypothetical protein